MPLQNRVTPFSTIEINPARGLFTGNRGILHNSQKQLVTTRWRHKAWIVCVLQYKNWRRELMTPNRWTELFFLDEATAFAAGHRPCGFCRRDAYRRFLALSGFSSAKTLDAALHQERTGPQQNRRVDQIPNLTMFAANNEAFLQLPGQTLRWTHAGYQPHPSFPPQLLVQPLTPPTTARVMAANYDLVLHPTASYIPSREIA